MMATGDDALHQVRLVDCAPEVVLAEFGIVVVSDAVPVRSAVCASDVRVLKLGGTDDVKGALGARFL